MQSEHVERTLLSDTGGKGPLCKHEVAPWQPRNRVSAWNCKGLGRFCSQHKKGLLLPQAGLAWVDRWAWGQCAQAQPGSTLTRDLSNQKSWRGAHIHVLTSPQGRSDARASGRAPPQSIKHDALTRVDSYLSSYWRMKVKALLKVKVFPKCPTPLLFLPLKSFHCLIFPSQPAHCEFWNPRTC